MTDYPTAKAEMQKTLEGMENSWNSWEECGCGGEPPDWGAAMPFYKNFPNLLSYIRSLKAQIPEGMQDCTIIFEECPVGHGSLRGTNWIKHECAFCKINKLEKEHAAMKEALKNSAPDYCNFFCRGLNGRHSANCIANTEALAFDPLTL